MSMKFSKFPRVLGVGLTGMVLLLLAQGAVGQTVFEVNSVGDQPLQSASSTVCTSTANTCTFRAALQAANNRSGPVEIRFTNIPVANSTSSSILQPGSEFPTINQQVTISGDTHPNWLSSARIPRVVIRGTNAGGGARGLIVGSGGAASVVRGLAIANYTDYGIHLFNTNDVRVEDNWIGVFSSAGFSLPVLAGNSGAGIYVENSSGVSIVDNLISDNGSGIELAAATTQTLIAGNRIGFRTNLEPAGNRGPGIQIQPGAGANNAVGRCVPAIGPFPGFCSGNLIVGNEGHGVHIRAAGQSVVVNAIGFNASQPSLTEFGNEGDGVRIEADDVTISQGAISGAGNVIGFNSGAGIRVLSGSNATILANSIGIGPDDQDAGNLQQGVRIDAGGNHTISENRIANNAGGIRSASGPTLITDNEVIDNGSLGIEATDWRHTIEDNVVGLHGLIGIALAYPYDASQAASVYGNWVGTAPDGTPLGNSNGIVVNAGRAFIGQNQSRGNIVAGNANAGIVLTGARNVLVRGNFIGQLPDGTPSGNRGAGILIQPRAGGIDAFDSQIGYLTTAGIPSEHFPVAAGGFGQGNLIAHNELGIRVDGGSGAIRHRLRGNSIFNNQLGGVQIFGQIGQINEGAGEGPNRLLNHPQLDDNATFLGAGSGTVQFRLRVPTSANQATYPLRVDFYITDPNESQGRFFIGSVDYPEAAANSWLSGSFSPLGSYNLANALVVAMATDGQGNSSEFSATPADLSQGSPSPLDSIMISSLGDAPNADPSSLNCDAGTPFIAPGVPNCTLRAAIQAANNHNGPVTISFWSGLTASNGVSTFSPSTPLPSLRSGVTLAGDTHASFDPDAGPSVVISGSSQASGALLRVGTATDVEIRSIALIASPGLGLQISDSSNVRVSNSLLGLRPSGGAFLAAGNGDAGISVASSTNILLTDNWVADNPTGVRVQSSTSDLVLEGNIIGAGRTADGALTPAGRTFGVLVTEGAGDGIQIGRCIGLPPQTSCKGNVIVASGNGVELRNAGTTMAANFIGVNPASPTDANMGNSQVGVILAGTGHLLTSGLVIGQGANVIGHAGSQAIVVDGSEHTLSGVFVGVTPAGQNIGSDATGILVDSGQDSQIISSRIANHLIGVLFASPGNRLANSTILDNTSSGISVAQGGQIIENNVIGGNANGIVYTHAFESSPAGLLRIIGNRIGLDEAGEPIPNQIGILAQGGGRADIGADDGNGNEIGFNVRQGAVLRNARGSRLRGNWIGLLADGTAAPNGAQGIWITATAAAASIENAVGFSAVEDLPANHADGSAGAFGNVIANHPIGILLGTTATDAVIERNSLRGNRFIANQVPVQLGDSPGGIDPGGAQSGPNRLQNPPEFDPDGTSYDAPTGTLAFGFRVDTLSTNANYPLRVDIYLVENGQPSRFLHTETYPSSSATQFVSGSFVPTAGLVDSGDRIVAMATDLAGNSSEFSAPVSLGERGDAIFSDRFEED